MDREDKFWRFFLIKFLGLKYQSTQITRDLHLKISRNRGIWWKTAKQFQKLWIFMKSCEKFQKLWIFHERLRRIPEKRKRGNDVETQKQKTKYTSNKINTKIRGEKPQIFWKTNTHWKRTDLGVDILISSFSYASKFVGHSILEQEALNYSLSLSRFLRWLDLESGFFSLSFSL